MQVKKYTVTVFDDSYTLMSDEPEQSFMQAVNYVDSLMHEISSKSQCLDAKRIAVLTALKIAHSLLQAESKLHHDQDRLNKILQELESCI